MKKLYLLITLVFLATNVYAVITPDVGFQRNAADDDNTGREHIDIIVRNLPDDRDPGYLTAGGSNGTYLASEGAIVIWSTESRAIIGRDVTMTQVASASLVAGIISEPDGIASNSYGRMRIYGYFDDVLAADATDPIAQGESLRTSLLLGQVGGGANFIPSAGISLDAGSGSDLAEIQAMIKIRQ